MPTELITWLEQNLQTSPSVAENLLATAVAMAVLLLGRLTALALINRRVTDSTAVYRLRKTVGYVTALLAVLALSLIWLDASGSLLTYISLLSAALVIALQDPITNLVGWAFIVWRKPFEVGDRIQLGEDAGDVIDQRAFQFTILELGNWVDADQSTGRILHIPNRMVFSDAIANYSKGFGYIWNELPVLVTFESDWELAKGLLQEIAERHAAHLSSTAAEQVRAAARRYMIHYDKLTPIVYTKVMASGVRLTVRYLCLPRQRRSTEQAIWEDILRAVSAEDTIEFAYPTQRIYYHPTETRPPLRPGDFDSPG